MQLLFSSILILAVASCVYAEAGKDSKNDGLEKSFRAGGPEPSYDVKEEKNEGRFIFKTVSVTLQTLTITSTSTAVSTCTTSTGGLSVCTASGRRRRGLHLSGNKEGRGLFYNENEEDNEDGNVFLPSVNKVDDKPVQSEAIREAKESSVQTVPFVVQPGFDAPAGQGRVYLAFGTSTITTTTTTTSTSTLTAICISTTGFQVCGSQGK
ncbi:uncharacterized protein LOC130691937 [Daphnia carinata]|uniref:uncharacterized protein LOC130691937 n=1 Tax=Daphnia carinata TaxID=120202 RepID=UPI00257FC29E|nr:uncharacterized protein LOC130691937 [Daphnia carinata]